MELGLKKDEVKIVSYDFSWKSEFERVKESVLHVLNVHESQVEHIGSTAIEGIKAKPIIDSLLGVENLEYINRDFEKVLQSIGFYRLRIERENGIVFAKFNDEQFETKTHFIRAVNYNGELWRNLLFFRDYLNENETEKKAYETVKKAYVQHHSTGINDYTHFKEQFVQRVFFEKISNLTKKG